MVKDMAGRKIAHYFSGRRHAGENLDDVLERRSPSLPYPILQLHDRKFAAANVKAAFIFVFAKATPADAFNA